MENVLDKYVCDNLPEAPLRMACHSLVFELAPYLVDEVYKHESPDTVCHQVKLCAQESQYCHLFPLPSSPNSDICWTGSRTVTFRSKTETATTSVPTRKVSVDTTGEDAIVTTRTAPFTLGGSHKVAMK